MGNTRSEEKNVDSYGTTLSKIEKFNMSGKIEAACIIVQDVRQELLKYQNENTNSIIYLLDDINKLSQNLNKALRMMGYIVHDKGM